MYTDRSGVSFGGGMTTGLDSRHVGGHIFHDTPGLSDVQLRKQAAEAITEALQKGGPFKIFFVVTLEAGRVRPADVTTMQLILKSAPIQNFGVIFNKLSISIMKKLDMVNAAGLPERKQFEALLLSQVDTEA